MEKKSSNVVLEVPSDSFERFRKFLTGNERYFILPLNCPADQVVSYVYAVFFQGVRKYSFYFKFLVARIAQYIDYSPLKVFLYRLIGMKIGRGVYLSPDVILDPTFPDLIEIGDHTILGWGVKLFTHEATKQKYRVGRIKIGKEVMLGAYSLVRGGVTIGDGAETTFQSFVLEDIPAGGRVGLKDMLLSLDKLAEF